MKRNQFFSCKGIQMMLLAVLMLLPSMVYGRSETTKDYNGLTWRTITDGSKTWVELVGIAQGFESTTGFTVLSSYNGNPVESIAPEAFKGNTKLVQVRFQDGYNHITIGDRAFEGCTSLMTVTMNMRVDGIGEEAFQNCTSLLNLDGYDNVEYIKSHAFANCTKLNSFTIYGQLREIGNGTFFNSGLATLTISKWNSNLGYKDPGPWGLGVEYIIGVEKPWPTTNIGQSVFAHTKLTSIPSGMRAFSPGMFYGCTNLKSVTIPSYVTVIPPYCFDGCTQLSKVDLNATREIWSHAFRGVSWISDITISGSITDIQKNAFYSVSNLTIANNDISKISTANNQKSYLASHFGDVINLNFSSSCTQIGSNWASNTWISTLSFIKYASIGEGAFAGCRAIKGELTLAGGTIAKDAFNGTGYTSVDLKANTLLDGAMDGLTVSSLTMDNCQFGSEAFLHAKLTGGVSIDNCDIPTRAFARQNITGLSIGANVKSIGEDAFSGCSSLADVGFKTRSTTLTINSGAFANCPELLDMTIGNNIMVKKDAFKGSFLISENNSAYGATDLTINNLSNIEAGAFSGAKFRRINVLDVNPTGDGLQNTMTQQINFENATKLGGTGMLDGSTVEILYAPKLQDITQLAVGDARNLRDFGSIKNGYLSTSSFDFGCVYSADRKTLVFVAPGRNEAMLDATVEKIDLRGTDVMASGDRTKRGIPVIDASAITDHKVTPINDESRYSCAKYIRVATGCRKYFTDFEKIKNSYKPTLVQNFIKGDVNDDGKVTIADANAAVNLSIGK